MIAQVRLRIKEKPELLQPSVAYPLYAWLLSQISIQEGERLHEQGMHPVSQYLWCNPKEHESRWTVNLLNDEAVELFAHFGAQKDSGAPSACADL